MMPDKIVYTDGHEVTVTDSALKVKNTSYNLSGITKYGLMIIKPHRLPGILLFLLGVIMVVCGMLGLLSPQLEVNGDYVNANTMALWFGGGLALLGILVIGLVRERYAVRIATAEGEKNAVVSHQKEYISQIVDALNRAIGLMRPSRTGPRTTYATE
jgi:hypothetical protein